MTPPTVISVDNLAEVHRLVRMDAPSLSGGLNHRRLMGAACGAALRWQGAFTKIPAEVPRYGRLLR